MIINEPMMQIELVRPYAGCWRVGERPVIKATIAADLIAAGDAVHVPSQFDQAAAEAPPATPTYFTRPKRPDRTR